ncbi:MAG TPA: hypothetical protein VFT39_18605 [Vicinamibacterales bacterium]|nr:hypothetical protein [Vicinamibacterales bacterium]
MTLKMKQIAVATLLALTTTMIAPATTLSAQQTTPTTPRLAIPIVGSGGGATFNGTFTLQRFVARNGQLLAIGNLSGTLTNAAGVVTGVLQNVALPAAVTDATCEILHLDLGPLSLNILGLQIDLSRVVLDITAQSGAGNLLGNLLCGVANLLNNPSGLAQLLNQILAAL